MVYVVVVFVNHINLIILWLTTIITRIKAYLKQKQSGNTAILASKQRTFLPNLRVIFAVYLLPLWFRFSSHKKPKQLARLHPDTNPSRQAGLNKLCSVLKYNMAEVRQF